MVEENTDVSSVLVNGEPAASEETTTSTDQLPEAPKAHISMVVPNMGERDEVMYTVRLWKSGKAEIIISGMDDWHPMLTLIVAGLYDLVGDAGSYVAIGGFTPPKDTGLLGQLMAIVHKWTPVGHFYINAIAGTSSDEVNSVLNEIYEAGEVTQQ